MINNLQNIVCKYADNCPGGTNIGMLFLRDENLLKIKGQLGYNLLNSLKIYRKNADLFTLS